MTTSFTTLEAAIRVFLAGFAFTRSYTHPYCCDAIAPSIWRLYDGPRRRGNYRREEIVAFGVAPAELNTLARSIVQSNYSFCYLIPDGNSDREVRAAFKDLGCRLVGTEALMIHPLEHFAASKAPFPIVRVQTDEQSLLFAKATRRRPLPPAVWKGETAPLRQYVALDGEAVVGSVGSVTANGSAWCSNMFVEPRYRRRGIATALLYRMLQDDKAAGLATNVLLASHAGAKLYPTVGYRVLGELLIYTPLRSRDAYHSDTVTAAS